MPRVYTKVARFDTYKQGAKVPADNKKGYRINRSKPRDENDTLFCKKGETYYVWSFRYGGTHRSTTRPKPSQLTQSEFLSTVYTWEENPIDCEQNWEEVQSAVEERIQEIEELRDETQDKLDNMPEQLQYAPTGELLQNRIDSLEEMISEYEAISIEEDSDLEDLNEEINAITYQGE